MSLFDGIDLPILRFTTSFVGQAPLFDHALHAISRVDSVKGVPVLDLPADPPSPQVPALELLLGASGPASLLHGPEFLSQLLFHAAAISATKRVPSAG